MALGHTGLPPGMQPQCWAQPGADSVPASQPAVEEADQMAMEASSGTSPRVNAVRTDVFGGSLLPLIPRDSKDGGGAGHSEYMLIT